MRSLQTKANGFFVDVVGTMPWDALLELISPGLRNPIYRLMRMIRVLRLLRALRLIDHLTSNRVGLFHTEYLEFLKFGMYVIMMAHLFACGFFLCPALFVTDCSEQVGSGSASAMLDGDCTPLGSWREAEGLQNMDAKGQYVWALYWSVSTITTIGYGDVTLMLQCEIVLVLFAQLFGIAFFALLIDHVVRLSDVFQEHSREAKEKHNAVVSFM